MTLLTFPPVMSYRISDVHVSPPLVVSHRVVEVSPKSLEMTLTVRGEFPSKYEAKRVTVLCAVPKCTERYAPSGGSAVASGAWSAAQGPSYVV